MNFGFLTNLFNRFCLCFLYSSNVFLFFLVIDYKQCFLKVDMDVRILGANSLDYQIVSRRLLSLWSVSLVSFSI